MAGAGQAIPQNYAPVGYVPQIPMRRSEDRSIVGAAGGIAALGNTAAVEKLSPDVGESF
jgi:chromatin structure-remodeling complex subunit RSC1/2